MEAQGFSNSVALDLVGWLSALLFMTMQIPQLWTTLRTRAVKGMNVWTWWMYTIALSLSVFYLMNKNPGNRPIPVIVNQSIGCLMGALQVLLYYRFRER